MSFVKGIMHIAYDVVAPTRQTHFLQAFGLDALYTFDRRGRYITVMGDPTRPLDAVGRQDAPVIAFFVPGLTRARLNHICFDVEDVDEAVRIIKKDGVDIDEEDADRIYGPEGLVFQVDSTTKPRREFVPGTPRRPEYTPIEEYERKAEVSAENLAKRRRAPINRPPPKNAGMVNGIEHLALDVESPTRLVSFMERAFGLTALKTFHRRGRYITSIGDPDAPLDPNGRRRSLLPTFFRPGIERGDINHICFDVDDVADAVQRISAAGHWVDEEDADRIYGPEDVVWQVESRLRPRAEFLPGSKPRPEYTPIDHYESTIAPRSSDADNR